MNSAAASSAGRRLSQLQSDLRRLDLDAFVITHLPNVRYLTGLNATAGLVVVRADRSTLVVDFRYETAARTLLGSFPDRPFDICLVQSTYDETLAGLLVSQPVSRIGVEASSMTVGRFHRVPAVIDRSILVPTERVVERHRAVKDASEIERLREAAR